MARRKIADEHITIGVKIDTKMYKALLEEAVKDERTLSSLLRKIFTEHLEKRAG